VDCLFGDVPPAWLLDADFDRSVSRIVAQPFLMAARVDGVVRRHIPDFLLLTGSGPLVVDVKPARRLCRPEVASSFAWSRQVVESRGWRFKVRSEPDPVRLENTRSFGCSLLRDHTCRSAPSRVLCLCRSCADPFG